MLLGLGVPRGPASSGASGIVGCMLSLLSMPTQGYVIIVTATSIAGLSICRHLFGVVVATLIAPGACGQGICMDGRCC